MEPPLVAVNICLVSDAFCAAAIPLSISLCPIGGPGYDPNFSYRLVSLAKKKLQKSYAHPHCTVAQLCVRSNDIPHLAHVVRRIWAEHREKAVQAREVLTLTRVQEGPVFGTLADATSVRLPSIVVERTPALASLHRDIVKVVLPLHVPPVSIDAGRAAFHELFPANNTVSVTWMAEFFDKHAGENYSPHITLGASPLKDIERLAYLQATSVPWGACRLVVSRMGNFCSCFELLA